jgi:flavodoxin
MKILVIYYSLEGDTKMIAEAIAQSVGADILALQPRREVSKGSFGKYFWGGRQVVFKTKPELLTLTKNPQDYDLLFIGTPVWAWNYTPVLRSFFDQVKLNHKKIALFACYGGDLGRTFVNMKRELEGNEIIGEKGFLEPLKHDPEAQKKAAAAWAQDLVG